MKPFECIVMGAAGRDFHDFRTFLRTQPSFHVCAFTAHQIPFIEARVFPRSLAGDGYDADIPIHPEEELEALVRAHDVDFVFLCYSDLSHEDVMHKASVAQAAGASFVLLGPKHTELRSTKPVVAVTAVRTGAGKSPLSQALAVHLRETDHRVGILRHPMPYGDLARQVVQRFATAEDLDRNECTIEEREEYEPYVEQGLTIFAGVDYEAILRTAEAECDVILWDGGNNDTSFVRPDLSFVVVDALRPGHELHYHPGETNFRRADVLVINKVDGARPEAVAGIRERARDANPGAEIVEAVLEIDVDDPSAVRAKRVLVLEDGPTLTHGGMSFGAGLLAAQRCGAKEIIDPRPFAVGTIASLYRNYPHIAAVLPAMGYSDAQRRELRETIVAARPELVLDASPARLDRLLALELPMARVRYRFVQRSGRSVHTMVDELLARAKR